MTAFRLSRPTGVSMAAQTAISGDAVFGGVPTWVPSTAWEWTAIAGTTWTDFVKDDGTGIVPAVTGVGDPGPTVSYRGQWVYGAPCYSREHHEVYVFSGGHAATTLNALTRWNMSLNSPTVTLVSGPSSTASRNTYLQNEDWRTTNYLPDGIPASPHAYWNNAFCDTTDEFISFGVVGTATGYPTASGVNAGGPDVAACSRAGVWRAENYYGDVTKTLSSLPRGPRTMSYDTASLYYWDGNDAGDTADLRRFVIGTNTHSTIGASVIPFYSRQAANSSGTALVLGGDSSSAGWQAKFVNLSTGATTAVTVTGSISTGLSCFDVQWREDKGYWLTVWFNDAAANSAGGAGDIITSVMVATIVQTGANTATATVRTMSGTPPARSFVLRGAFYDPAYSCVVVVTSPDEALKVFKVDA